MNWDKKIKIAKFNDIEFFVSSSDYNFTRKIASFNLVNSNFCISQDLGVNSTEFNIKAFVLGEDYLKKKESLLYALKKKDGGILIHPFLQEEKKVYIKEIKINEKNSQIGIANFNITFIEQQSTPQVKKDYLSINKENLTVAFEKVNKNLVKNKSFLLGAEEFINEIIIVLAKINAIIAMPSRIAEKIAGKINSLKEQINKITKAPQILSDALQTIFLSLAFLNESSPTKKNKQLKINLLSLQSMQNIFRGKQKIGKEKQLKVVNDYMQQVVTITSSSIVAQIQFSSVDEHNKNIAKNDSFCMEVEKNSVTLEVYQALSVSRLAVEISAQNNLNKKEIKVFEVNKKIPLLVAHILNNKYSQLKKLNSQLENTFLVSGKVNYL